MNKKGFTLMELLAVIVILSVLILLAMPAVLRLMENAKKNAFITESQEILKIANTAYADKIAKGETVTEITLEELKTEGYTDKDFSSTSGKVEFERDANGVITSKLTYSNETYSVSEATMDEIKSKTTKGEIISYDESLELTEDGKVICQLSYRTFGKVGTDFAIAGYYYGTGGYTGPIIASYEYKSTNCFYGARNFGCADPCLDQTKSFTYKNRTWYYQGESCQMPGNLTSSNGIYPKLSNTALTELEAAKKLVKMYYKDE